jgi:hypothetical protein
LDWRWEVSALVFSLLGGGTLQKLIIFLIRKRLGLRAYEKFQFENQKTTAVYWFTSTELLKSEHGETSMSGVSLNWLLNKECSVRTVVV